jgi:hypothetical protein
MLITPLENVLEYQKIISDITNNYTKCPFCSGVLNPIPYTCYNILSICIGNCNTYVSTIGEDALNNLDAGRIFSAIRSQFIGYDPYLAGGLCNLTYSPPEHSSEGGSLSIKKSF